MEAIMENVKQSFEFYHQHRIGAVGQKTILTDKPRGNVISAYCLNARVCVTGYILITKNHPWAQCDDVPARSNITSVKHLGEYTELGIDTNHRWDLAYMRKHNITPYQLATERVTLLWAEALLADE
jgi:hypothetical protein